MNKEEFVEELSHLRPASTFLTLRGYRNAVGEVADYSVAFHINYKAALEKSIQQLQALKLKTPLEKMARTELIDSFNKSLVKMAETPIEDITDGYTRFFDDDGNYIKGVKMHNATTTLHMYGLVVHKRVLMPGNYPVVDSKPLTIAKDKLRYLTTAGRFRQFRITEQQVESIRVQNITLLPPYDHLSVFI
jgi:hypothetical protein